MQMKLCCLQRLYGWARRTSVERLRHAAWQDVSCVEEISQLGIFRIGINAYLGALQAQSDVDIVTCI